MRLVQTPEIVHFIFNFIGRFVCCYMSPPRTCNAQKLLPHSLHTTPIMTRSFLLLSFFSIQHHPTQSLIFLSFSPQQFTPGLQRMGTKSTPLLKGGVSTPASEVLKVLKYIGTLVLCGVVMCGLYRLWWCGVV